MYVRRFRPNKTQSDIDHTVRFIIRSAARYISAYRRLLEQFGVSTIHVRGIADLPLLPIVKKEALFRDAPLRDQLHSRVDVSRCVCKGTSGATGLPVNVYMSKAEALFRQVQLVAAWHRSAHFPLRFRVADVGSWVTKESGYEQVRRGAASILRISIALSIDRQIDLLKHHAPHVVSGYPTALLLLAERLRELSTPLSVCLVATRGEVLYASVRAVIERAFGGRVADFYNCEEVGNIASECPEDTHALHINTDACIVEVVNDEGSPVPAGMEGRILLTNLYNCTMPFIRYDIQDRGMLLPDTARGRCVCGSRRPRMAMLGGRDDDYIFFPDGRRVSPRLVATAVNRAFAHLSPHGAFDRFFRRFQVVQDALDHVTIRIIPELNRSMDFETVIADAFRKLNSGLRCTVVLVNDLPHEPSGKFKKVIRSIE